MFQQLGKSGLRLGTQATSPLVADTSCLDFSNSALFDRVLSLKQSSKKAKSILKKWLAFEKKSGDAKGEQEVLKRAREFVEEMKKKETEGEGNGEGEED